VSERRQRRDGVRATQVSVLNIEVLKRGLKSKYRFVETREATAMYDKYEVMEVTLSGHWYEIVKGQPKESYGDRSFQGIGKTTREAKQAAAKAALTKLRATMPGIKFKPGVIPFEWSDWCRKNLKRGALLEDLLKTLTTKGFHPAKNPGFMEKFLLIRSWAYAFGEPFPPQEKVRPEPVYPEIVSRVQFDDGVVDRVRKDFDQSKKLSTALTRRLFLNFSELQVRVDGVNATRCHRDAVDVAVRASTRLARSRSSSGTTRLAGPGARRGVGRFATCRRI